MNTKIFCDIADIKLIKKFSKKKIVKGFTTNPSLMRKAGAKDYKLYSNTLFDAEKKAEEFASKSMKRNEQYKVVEYTIENIDDYWY